MHIIIRITLIVAALGVAACASMADLSKVLEAKPSCCNSMSEFSYEPIHPGTASELLLTAESPVFTFATGKSYFKAFSLPANAAVRKLRVSSQPTGSIALETAKYSQSYCPRVLFLDNVFQEVGAAETIPTYRRGMWSSAFVSEFDIPASAKYAVLHTNPGRFGIPTFRYTSGGAYMVGGTVVVDRGGEAIRHPCGPVAQAVAEVLQ